WKENFTKWISGKIIDELGPYPRHGEYELVKVIETPKKKQFVPLTEAICDALVVTAKANRNLSVNVRYEAAKARREQGEAAKEQRQSDRIEHRERPSWAAKGKPHIIVPNIKEITKYSKKENPSERNSDLFNRTESHCSSESHLSAERNHPRLPEGQAFYER